MRRDARRLPKRQNSTGLLRATELFEGHDDFSRRAHAAPYYPRRDLRAGFRQDFHRHFRQGFRWPFRISLAKVPAIPNPARPAGFAFRRHLCGTRMSAHESRTRDSDLAADSRSPGGSRPYARRPRYRRRAGYASLLCRTRPSTGRRIARRGRWAAGGWLGVARRPPVRSSVRPPVRSPVRPLRGFDEGRVSRTPAPSAGFAFCRHSSVTQRSVHTCWVSYSFAWVGLARCALRSRRLRYRLRAGYATLLRPTALALRRAGGNRLMARRRGEHPESRRPRGRARSARVLAVHRKETDLDRFVAALLALACEPEGKGQRRPGQPRTRTGESSPTEQSCRRR